MPTNDLDVLLIEDNRGDARLIEEMLGNETELSRRIDARVPTAGGPHVYHENCLEAGLERLSEADVDVVLLDLGLPESTGLDTLATVVNATEFVPIVVLTGLRDEALGVEAIQRGAQDYLVKDEVTSDLLVRSIHHAIERTNQEYQQSQQVEQLEAINRLNRISQEITHAVISVSTREELERAVCERLVESDAYRFAWIGEVNRTNGRILPRVTAGVEDGYLDEITVTVGGDETAQGPAGTAVRTRAASIMQNVQTDPEFEPWREEAKARAYRSCVSVPITYGDILYGVVNVYAASPNAFSEPEVEILSRLGDVIGHAITAIERKDALTNETGLELEFRMDGVLEELVGLAADRGGTIGFGTLVCRDDLLITYGQTKGVPREEFRDVAEQANTITDFRFLSSEHNEYEFELITESLSPLVTAVATHGGHVMSATIANGEFRLTIEFPAGRDKRQLVELVQEHCPGAVPRAQRTVQRDITSDVGSRSVLQTRLTEKQRTALETAFSAGFFEWPRTSTGEEVADRLGIAPATFAQHLRAAERKFFDTVFAGEGD